MYLHLIFLVIPFHFLYNVLSRRGADSMALYNEIADVIEKRIIDSVYQGGCTLPDHETLAKEFKTSRPTIKKAIDLLSSKGLVTSNRGKGTYVLKIDHADIQRAFPVGMQSGLSFLYDESRIENKIIKFDIHFPDEKIQRKLQIARHEAVYEIIRFRKIDGEPAVIEHTFMPIKQMPNLSKRNVSGSIYDYLMKELKLEFAGALRTIHAVIPGEYDKEFLKNEAGDPLLEIEQIVFLTDGSPVEYSKTRHRNDYTIYDTKFYHR